METLPKFFHSQSLELDEGHSDIEREYEIRAKGPEEQKSATFNVKKTKNIYFHFVFSFAGKCAQFMFISSIYDPTISQIPSALTYNTVYICIGLKFCDANALCAPVEKTREQLALASFLIKRA